MNKRVDINIYFREMKADDTQNMLVNLTGQLGVLSARVNDYIQRLITIEYNPEQVAASKIMDRLKQQGIHGALIGI